MAEDSDVRELLIHVTDFKNALPDSGKLLGEENLAEEMKKVIKTEQQRENMLEVLSRIATKVRRIITATDKIKEEVLKVDVGVGGVKEEVHKVEESLDTMEEVIKADIASVNSTIRGEFKDVRQQMSKLTKIIKEVKDNRDLYSDCQGERRKDEEVVAEVASLELLLEELVGGLVTDEDEKKNFVEKWESFKAHSKPTLEKCLSATMVVWAPALAIICIQTGILGVMVWQRFCCCKSKNGMVGNRMTSRGVESGDIERVEHIQNAHDVGGGSSVGGDYEQIQAAQDGVDGVGQVGHGRDGAVAGGRHGGVRRLREQLQMAALGVPRRGQAGPPVPPKSFRLDSRV